MSSSGKRPEWDDGRTVADMHEVERPSLFRPRRADTDTSNPPGQEQQESPYTPQERRWAVLGALRATLLIAAVFLAGLALVIAVLLWIWR